LSAANECLGDELDVSVGPVKESRHEIAALANEVIALNHSLARRKKRQDVIILSTGISRSSADSLAYRLNLRCGSTLMQRQ
jgi:hypothetical protein